MRVNIQSLIKIKELGRVRLQGGTASPIRRHRQVLPAALLVALWSVTLHGSLAYAYTPSVSELADLSLEQLSNIQVTSVSRRAESLQDAPASIYVISAEDILRSGANTLPEALRLAPNLQVARVSASSYAISARGFNNDIGNKLLVLVDGRTVYTPLFSGVFWDAQDVMLEDIERIEVISGPGATLWGANAMNGVINIITRSAKDTQGVLAVVGGGNRETGGAVRQGGSFGGDGHYRIYAKGFDQFNTELPGGLPVRDRFQREQVGFRADRGDGISTTTLQGDVYSGVSESDAAGKPVLSGANLLGRYIRVLENGSNLSAQAYFDHSYRDDPFTYSDRIDLFDFEVQHAFTPVSRQKILWGGGVRYARDSTVGHFFPGNILPEQFLPANQSLKWSNLFVQDQIALNPQLELTAGMKVETNVYTHAEFMPNLRLGWKPDGSNFFWADASRSVRAPARLDRDFFLYLQQANKPLVPIIIGGPDFQSEIARVYEIGHRAQPTPQISYSVTAFYSLYDKLRSGNPPPNALVQNMMAGTTDGVEAWGSYRVAKSWRLSAGLLEMREHLRILTGSRDPTGPSALGNDPKHQVELRSSHDLSDALSLDILARHVGALPKPVVPAYTAMDMRLGWRATRKLEVSLLLQNMFDPHHVEFGTLPNASEIDRGVFLKLLWRP
jgi:iron complex outermembrane receptor protein